MKSAFGIHHLSARRTGELTDTWEWDGIDWQLRSVAMGPPGLAEGMAYDPVRGRTVLYAQRVDGGSLAPETWEWDGAAWTQRRASANPSWAQRGAVNGGVYFDATRGAISLLDGNGAMYVQSLAAAVASGGICVGSWGSSPFLSPFGQPSIGNHSFAVDLTTGIAGAPAVYFLGFGSISAPLPGGCRLLVNPAPPAAAVLGQTNAFGWATLPLGLHLPESHH
ncbi:MAG: hypothetical protein AAF628_20450 [Planctomycetota bacterium]